MEKKMNKIIFSIIILGLFTNIEIFGQISSGISNSKVIVLSSHTIPHHKLEFEPVVSYTISDNFWDKNGKSQKHKTINNQTGFKSGTDLSFRLTYGVTENIEAGFGIPANLETMGTGIKWKFFDNKTNAIAAYSGMNFNLENDGVVHNDAEGINTNIFYGGVVYTHAFTEQLSWDSHFTFGKPVNRAEEQHIGDIFIASEIGYYIGDYQFCIGFAYNNEQYETSELNAEVFSLILGGTIETGNDAVIIWGVPIDLFGKNTDITRTAAFSFTITIN
jgi:hypothetical protein